MPDARTVVLSARVDEELANRVESLARISGLTSSRLIEKLLEEKVTRTMESKSQAGSATLRFIAEANLHYDRPVDPEHPGVSIWELDANVWPRHFLRVVSEFGLDEFSGSTEIWLLWKGEEVEQISPEEHLARTRKKDGA